MRKTQARQLLPLLDLLAAAPPQPITWRGWRAEPVVGGFNNRVYRVVHDDQQLAVKFYRRDERDRAGREYAALRLLALCAPGLAPALLLLEHERYANPVMIQSWLGGLAQPSPPTRADEWEQQLLHYAALHRINPDTSKLQIAPAAVSVSSVQLALTRILTQLERIPQPARDPELLALVRQLQELRLPAWSEPALKLCRCDPKPDNFIRRPGAWASVDWENSGWGDPAFEIGDLLAHPAYTTLEARQRSWVVQRYCSLVDDQAAAIRIRSYYLLTLAWWAACFARVADELSRGRQPLGLAPRPREWFDGIPRQYKHYLSRSWSELEQWQASG